MFFNDIFFCRDILYLLQFCSLCILFFWIFICLSFIGFYQQAVSYQAGYFVGLRYGVSVELFVVLFSIFVVFEVGVYFIIIFISTLHLQYNIALHWYNFYYFNQHGQKTNKSIFQPIKQSNQLICPCNIPDQLIYFT